MLDLFFLSKFHLILTRSANLLFFTGTISLPIDDCISSSIFGGVSKITNPPVNYNCFGWYLSTVAETKKKGCSNL